jgi:N-acetylglucosaminylphosphatidylinositol deacetylase
MITGNADGLGETRIKELRKSAVLLGLRNEDDVFVIESPYENYCNEFIWDCSS